MTMVLVVDDDFSIRTLVASILRQSGYQCIEAESVDQAIKYLKDGIYQLVITDILMPEKDGIVLINYIKENGKNTKIIAMSGDGATKANSNLMAAKKVGCTATIEKPFSKEKLLGLIRSLEITP